MPRGQKRRHDAAAVAVDEGDARRHNECLGDTHASDSDNGAALQKGVAANPCARFRERHNTIERRRVGRMNARFDELRSVLGLEAHTCKQEVLDAAIERLPRRAPVTVTTELITATTELTDVAPMETASALL